MLAPELEEIARAQALACSRFSQFETSELGFLLDRALVPRDVHRAMLKEQPLLTVQRKLDLGRPSAQELRTECAAVGLLNATPHDLDYRRLYPGLDVGIYCCNHSIGKPSAALLPALEAHLLQLPSLGRQVFDTGDWLLVLDDFRAVVAQVVGGDLLRGDVVHYENWSDGHSALLNGLRPGRLVTTAGHFTSAHYIQTEWARRTGAEVVVVALDESGCVPAEHVIDALTADTAIISLSHALYRNGYLQDIEAIAEAAMDVCPEAAFLLDAYQTLGTVPVSIGRLPMRTAVLGGGIKQLRAGTGAGFGWISHPLLQDLTPDRLGWWSHEEPLAFAPELSWGRGGNKLRRGSPSLLPLVALITELRVFATSGVQGDIKSAVKRARLVTSTQVEAAVERALELGLQVEGPRDARRRAAFFAVRVPKGEVLVEALAQEGVIVDYRADAPGADQGLLRVSANSASFGYELLYAVERLASLMR